MLKVLLKHGISTQKRLIGKRRQTSNVFIKMLVLSLITALYLILKVITIASSLLSYIKKALFTSVLLVPIVNTTGLMLQAFRPMQENNDPTINLFWHWLKAFSKKRDILIFEKTLMEQMIMDIRPIKTETDYEWALAEIEQLFDADLNMPDGDRLDVLVTLVEAYEDKHYSIPLPDPIEMIKYYMESRGLTRRDLEPYIGTRARVSEILNKKRPLTLNMIRKLHTELGIPGDVLLQPVAIAA